MYTAAIMKTELEASKGTRKLDMRIDNIQLVNVFTREIYPASIGIYNKRIVAVGRVETEADQVIDGAGALCCSGPYRFPYSYRDDASDTGSSG